MSYQELVGLITKSVFEYILNGMKNRNRRQTES